MEDLRMLAPIGSHPAPESTISSALSSALSDPGKWYDCRRSTLASLDESYVPNGPRDDTAKVLRAFLMKLPKEGQLVLASEITELCHDSIKLRQLRNFLVDAILKPSTYTALSTIPLSNRLCSENGWWKNPQSAILGLYPATFGKTGNRRSYERFGGCYQE